MTDDNRPEHNLTDAKPPETDALEHRRPPGDLVPRSRLGWLLGVLVLIAVAAVAWWIGARTQSPDQAAAKAQPPEPSWITVPVERRVLSSTVITRGDVRPDARTDVGVPISVDGDPVLTRQIVKAGDVIDNGDPVVEISSRPVFVLGGDVASFRTLKPEMTGDDVAALQQGLIALGYDADADGVFAEKTKTAVTQFYVDAGYDPISTSDTFDDDLAAANRAVEAAEAELVDATAAVAAAAVGPSPSAVRAADAAVAEATRTLEAAQAAVETEVSLRQNEVNVAVVNRDTVNANPEATADERAAAESAVVRAQADVVTARRATADAVAAANDQLDIARLARAELDVSTLTDTAQTDLRAAERDRDDAIESRDALVATNGPTVPLGEIVFVSKTPVRVLSSVATLGSSAQDDAGTTAGPAVTLASGDLVITSGVRPDQIGLIRVGQVAELLDELTGTAYSADVSAVADTATAIDGGQLLHQVTLTATRPLPDELAGANLRVTLTAASTGTEQLVVPLAAVSSDASGAERVSILDSDTGEPVDVSVRADLSADGFVAITPTNAGELDEGDAVIVGR